MLDKILFRQLRFSLFLQHVTLTYVFAGFCQSTFSTLTYTFQRLNNKVADQTVRLRRLVCAFVIEMQLPLVFFATRPITHISVTVVLTPPS